MAIDDGGSDLRGSGVQIARTTAALRPRFPGQPRQIDDGSVERGGSSDQDVVMFGDPAGDGFRRAGRGAERSDQHPLVEGTRAPSKVAGLTAYEIGGCPSDDIGEARRVEDEIGVATTAQGSKPLARSS